MKPIYDAEFFDAKPAEGIPYGPWRDLNARQMQRDRHNDRSVMRIAMIGCLVLFVLGPVAVYASLIGAKAVAEVERALNPNCDAVKCVMPIGEE